MRCASKVNIYYQFLLFDARKEIKKKTFVQLEILQQAILRDNRRLS